MNSDQKKVAVGAFSGVVGMVVLIGFLYSVLPPIAEMQTPLERLVFALHMNVLATLPLFVGLVVVGNRRFFSNAINPLRHAEDRAMEINGRFVDNTLEQNFVFLVGTLSLSTFLDESSIKLILALTITYILARVVFWIGYRLDPLYRAPGMAATAYMNVGILLATLYLLFFWG